MTMVALVVSALLLQEVQLSPSEMDQVLKTALAARESQLATLQKRLSVCQIKLKKENRQKQRNDLRKSAAAINAELSIVTSGRNLPFDELATPVQRGAIGTLPGGTMTVVQIVSPKSMIVAYHDASVRDAGPSLVAQPRNAGAYEAGSRAAYSQILAAVNSQQEAQERSSEPNAELMVTGTATDRFQEDHSYPFNAVLRAVGNKRFSAQRMIATVEAVDVSFLHDALRKVAVSEDRERERDKPKRAKDTAADPAHATAARLANARNLVKAGLYAAADKMLRKIIDDAPGTEIAAEAQKELDAMPAH
jgi:TolA-binding protein